MDWSAQRRLARRIEAGYAGQDFSIRRCLIRRAFFYPNASPAGSAFRLLSGTLCPPWNDQSGAKFDEVDWSVRPRLAGSQTRLTGNAGRTPLTLNPPLAGDVVWDYA